MDGPVYPGAFGRRGLDWEIPDAADRAIVHDVIMDELCLGIFTRRVPRRLCRIIDESGGAGLRRGRPGLHRDPAADHRRGFAASDPRFHPAARQGRGRRGARRARRCRRGAAGRLAAGASQAAQSCPGGRLSYRCRDLELYEGLGGAGPAEQELLAAMRSRVRRFCRGALMFRIKVLARAWPIQHYAALPDPRGRHVISRLHAWLPACRRPIFSIPPGSAVVHPTSIAAGAWRGG